MEKESSAGELEAAAQMRVLARQIFLEALREATVAKAFARNLEYHRGVLRICDDLYDLRAFARVFVLAAGKASRPMVAALKNMLGEMASGIVVEPESARSQPLIAGFRHFYGGHPTPNAESVAAAAAALKSLSAGMANSLVIYLLSGGGSAMFEKPLDDEITLADLIAINRALVFSGAPIARMNAIRKHLSAVKGGRLALAAHTAGATRQVSIMVSDVPEEKLDALASGPTMPDSSTAEECYEIAGQYKLLSELPASVRIMFQQRSLPETPKQDDPAFRGCRWWPVLSNRDLQKAAGAAAARAGFAVEFDNSCDDWDYARAAGYLVDHVKKLRAGVSRVCLISGGEVTVRVPPEVAPGAGGRNQHFALHCAELIRSENIAVLSAASDGADGLSPAAGAVADGTTFSRARQKGLSITQHLAGFNSDPLFRALGDEVTTGPTENNIRDLRILLAW